MGGKRILIADDHPLAREGLTLAVKHAIPGALVTSVGSIAEAEEIAARPGVFSLALLDLLLPDTRGFSGLLRLQFCLPRVPIVLITAREEQSLPAIARNLGAAGFLLKSSALDELADALRKIAAGQAVFPDDTASAPVATTSKAVTIRDRIAALSRAQRRVLFAMADGAANKRIAYDLDVGEATVKAHLTAIFRRLGVTNRMQAILAVQPLLGEREP